MFKVHLICVGKLKESYWREAVAEYSKRLSRFCALDIRELPERATLSEEASDILRAARGHIVALAVEGKGCSSEAFAQEIAAVRDKGEELTLLIGSSCGLAPEVKAASQELLSFSAMTFPHQMMRVILLEQLYRAFMIINSSALSFGHFAVHRLCNTFGIAASSSRQIIPKYFRRMRIRCE